MAGVNSYHCLLFFVQKRGQEAHVWARMALARSSRMQLYKSQISRCFQRQCAPKKTVTMWARISFPHQLFWMNHGNNKNINKLWWSTILPSIRIGCLSEFVIVQLIHPLLLPAWHAIPLEENMSLNLQQPKPSSSMKEGISLLHCDWWDWASLSPGASLEIPGLFFSTCKQYTGLPNR
jgi:hypothetical protein